MNRLGGRPVPDHVQIAVNKAREKAYSIIEGSATDHDRELALAIQDLAQAIETLAAEVARPNR